MGDVNFYLKKPEKSGKALIYLQFKYQGQRFKYSTKQNIDPANWNDSKQRVKNNRVTTADGKHSLNDLLDNLEQVLLRAYHSEAANGIPAKSALKQALDSFINQNKDDKDRPTFFKLLDIFHKGEIKNKDGREKSYHTTKTYKTVSRHLQNFEKQHKYPIDFGTITLEFYRKYINYLADQKLAVNTRAKHIQIIKTVMNEAVDLRYTNNSDFRHKKFSVSWEDSDSVYLADKEILKLYRHDMKGNKRLENARDLFVFGCYVGLRFSDYTTVRPENIIQIENDKEEKEYFIRMLTTKTKELVIIPCNPIVLQIFEKYQDSPNKLPRAVSNQKFNEAIKEACKEAGLTEAGRLSTEPDKELWQCISSHTARRSFATNLYLEGFPVIDIMKITGHRTEKAFMRYIRVTKLDAAKRLNDHMRKQWSAKLLKVA
jgi:integrase